MTSKTFDIKHDLSSDSLMFLTPPMITLFAAFLNWADARNLPVVISSINEDVVGRKFKSHREGRSLDFSRKGWKLKDINDALEYFNQNYRGIAAISNSDKVPRALVYHKIEGGAYHFHLQVRPMKSEKFPKNLYTKK